MIIGATEIKLVQGDITKQETEAIVNAANSSLMGGGGVDGAIHRVGGSKILEECQIIRKTRYPKGLPTGEAVITTGGNLKASYVIHTVGPIWRGGDKGEPQLLKKSYVNTLRVAVETHIKTVAFPSISTGSYGYPIELASRIAISSVKEFIDKNDRLDKVLFVLFSQRDLNIYKGVLKELTT
jgi:O-acetyl-ADP-ribose deacetylase (regulator of RNase III)